jgi:hypothetical protein
MDPLLLASSADTGPTFNWIGFASGVFGALLGSSTQLLVHYSQAKREARQSRQEAFAAFEADVLTFVTIMSQLPAGPQPSHEAVFHMYALQSAVQRLRKRRRSWVEKQVAARISNRILQMSNYKNITQLGLLHHDVVNLLQEWEGKTFNPDLHPFDQEASFYPDFPMTNPDGSLAFPVADGATVESSGRPRGSVMPKPARRLFGIPVAAADSDDFPARIWNAIKLLTKS